MSDHPTTSHPSDSPEPPDRPGALDRMLAIWNERDPDKIRGGIEAVLHPEVLFIDPANRVVGHDAFEVMVKAFRKRFPNAVCGRASGVDAHHNLHRYHWEIHEGETLLIEGFDVTELDEQGMVRRVEGFFGKIPAR